MSEKIRFIIDDQEVEGLPGQTILEAAQAAGVYIPRLCHRDGLSPHGSCRVCTCLVNGRAMATCTQPVAPGIIVESKSERVVEIRRCLVEMLFVEGNHFCMFCERSGNCELQALAYRFGITAPRYPYLFPQRELDASHKEIFIDRNRCVLCGRCVRASREVDHKQVFDFVGRGPGKRVQVNAEAGLASTDAQVADEAMQACPVGAIVIKRTGYAVPVGQRRYDHEAIGSEIEQSRLQAGE